MIQNGLINEVLDFHYQHALPSSLYLTLDEDSDSPNDTDESSASGINIAIGYKELLPYILEVENQNRQQLQDAEGNIPMNEVGRSLRHSSMHALRRWVPFPVSPSCDFDV